MVNLRTYLAQFGLVCHFGPNIGILVGWFVSGFGARAVFRKTPIYFIYDFTLGPNQKYILKSLVIGSIAACIQNVS